MNRSIHRLLGRLRRWILPVIVGIVAIFWLAGLFDHLMETSFTEFNWPSSSSDIFADTHKLINGERIRGRLLTPSADLPILHSPRCSGQKFDLVYNLLIIVKSAVTNSKNRDVIRETWGKDHTIDDFNIRTVFVVGRFQSDSEHRSMRSALERESQIHQDLLVADMIDSYRNNTRKLLYSLRYANKPGEGCPSPDFVLLIDDDYMLSTHNLIRLLDKKSSQDLLYEGWRFDSSPFRFKLHKHAVSLADYPFNRYPAYISAGCVLLSRTSVEMFFYGSQLVQLYPFDDIYTGILAHFLRIRPTHNEAMLFWETDVSHEEWMTGKVIAAHGYDPPKLADHWPLVRFAVPG